MRKIMLFRPGALGDTILTFPALLVLRQTFPGAHITAIGNAPALALARDAGLVDKVYSFDLPWWAELFAEDGIRAPEARQMLEGTDLAVLWLRDQEGLVARSLFALGIPQVLSFPGRPAEGQRLHAADYLLATLAPVLGGMPPADVPVFPLALSPQAARWAASEWSQRWLLGQRVLVLHPGSGGPRKCWPPERYAALAERFLREDWRILLLRGPADEMAVAEVLRVLREGSPTVIGGRVQLLTTRAFSDLASLLSRATLYVGNDSGVSHLSAVVGTPTLALFGPTDPAVWAPRGPRVAVLWAGQVEYGQVQPAEMSALSVEEVYTAALRLLKQES